VPSLEDAPGILSARGISKSFGGVAALQDVSFDVRPGEVHALVGENGAGKSTLVKIIAGALSPDAGEVLFRGSVFRPSDPGAAANAGIGVVFQELPLIPDLTVAENVFFDRQPLTKLGTVDRRRMRSRTVEAFERFSLGGIDPDAPVSELSVASRQLVAIVKALAEDPVLLVLDEATAALGPSEVTWLLNEVRSVAETGVAVIYISHRLAEVADICSRLTVLRNGQSVGSWRNGELASDELVRAILGRQLGQLYPGIPQTVKPKVMLETRQLGAGRRLHNVNLQVREGEILGIAGLEGQGQLELILSLYGILSSRGSIWVDGVKRRIRSPREALKAGLGLALVPEDRKTEGLLPTLSVRENLVLPVLQRVSRFGYLRRRAEVDFVTPTINRLKIGRQQPEQLAGDLSGGNQQKVVVGKFLISGARVLLLYDLTRGVDVGAKAEMFRTLNELAAEGYSMLFYSSDVTELVNVAHRIVVMFDGTVFAELDNDGSVDEEKVVGLMLNAGEPKGGAVEEGSLV
jgi:ribose transport system ATP-binding protein